MRSAGSGRYRRQGYIGGRHGGSVRDVTSRIYHESSWEGSRQRDRNWDGDEGRGKLGWFKCAFFRPFVGEGHGYRYGGSQRRYENMYNVSHRTGGIRICALGYEVRRYYSCRGSGS